MFEEMGSMGSGYSKAMGLEKAAALRDKYQTTFDVDVYDVEGLEDFSIGVNGTILYDYEKEKMKENLSFTLSYYELFAMQVAVDKTDVYIDIPALYDGSICFDSQRIDEQYNNSIFKGYLGEELDEEVSLNTFNKGIYAGVDFYDRHKSDFVKLIKNAEIEKTDDVLEIEVGENTKKCRGYLVTLKKDDVNELLERYYQESGAAEENSYLTENDIALCLYLDNKNCIRQIQTEEDIKLDNFMIDQFSVALRMVGEENSMEVLKGKIGVSAEGETIEMNFDYSAEMEGKEYNQKLQFKGKNETSDLIGMDYTAVWNADDGSFTMSIDVNAAKDNIKVEGGGKLTTDTSVNSYELEFQDFEVYTGEKKIGSFDGNFRLEPLKEEIQISPSKEYPIFEFTEADFSSFALNCYEKLSEYSEMLEEIGDLF